MNTQQNIDMPAALEAMQTKATAAKSNAVVEPNIDEPAHKSKEADAPNVDTSAPKSITASHDSYVAHMAQLRGQPAFAVPLLVNSSNVVAQYPTMYGVGQSDPSFRAAVKFNGPDAAANLCVRCKDVKCPGLPNCVFESNCFLAQKCAAPDASFSPPSRARACALCPPRTRLLAHATADTSRARRELTCRACGVRTTRNTDMITRIRSGKYANLYVHMVRALSPAAPLAARSRHARHHHERRLASARRGPCLSLCRRHGAFLTLLSRLVVFWECIHGIVYTPLRAVPPVWPLLARAASALLGLTRGVTACHRNLHAIALCCRLPLRHA